VPVGVTTSRVTVTTPTGTVASAVDFTPATPAVLSVAVPGQVVAALHDTDASLSTVRLDFRATGSVGAARQDVQGHYYVDRP
jgi:hypothetical protein